MAEDKTPEQDTTTRPAAKKKPAAKKAAKKKAGAVLTKKPTAKKPAAKKAAAKKPAAKKTAARKTTAKKAPAPRASVATPVPAAVADDIPQAAPRPPPAPPPVSDPVSDSAHSGQYAYEADTDGDGMGGLLVTAGPLIILGFLILVMSNDRSPESTPQSSASSTVSEQAAEAAALASPQGLTEESLKELIVNDAAKDLSEAFKEAGLNLPASGQMESSTATPETLEFPAELQNNPWAPQQPGQAGADNNVPPPAPGYNQSPGQPPGRGFAQGQYAPPGSWGQHGQMRGYNPYNPYQRGYPMQPPPGYGMAVNPYWAPMPGYGVPQGYPPQGHYPQHSGRFHHKKGGEAPPAPDQKPSTE